MRITISTCIWTLIGIVCFFLGCTMDSPKESQAPATPIAKPTVEVPEKAQVKAKVKPQATPCDFTALYKLIQFEYEALQISRRPTQTTRLEGGFDFVQWRPTTKKNFEGIVTESFWNADSSNYFRFNQLRFTREDVELFAVKEAGFTIVFLNIPVPEGQKKPITGRWLRVPAFPNVPGCFVQIPGDKYIYYVTGANDDGTIFSSPFSNIFQAQNIYLCNGSLWPKHRIGFSNGKTKFVTTYRQQGKKRFEAYFQIDKGAKLELDSVCLSKLAALPSHTSRMQKEEENEILNAEPEWLMDFGVAKYTPKVIIQATQIKGQSN